jgi:hypothetical protein
MKHVLRRRALFLWLVAAAAFWLPQPAGTWPASSLNQDTQDHDVKLPNGKSQRDEILRSEHEENLRDATRLVELSQDLKADLEKTDTFVLSMGTIKKTDDIEKLVKTIRSRMRH